VDPKSKHDRACSSRKVGTGAWFTEGQNYRNWLITPKSFLWLNGKPGCGKTVLSSTIVQNIAIYCDENEGCVMAYFYFSFTDPAKEQCSNMLCSILAQLAAQVDITPECLASLHRAYQRGIPPPEELKSSLQILVNEMPFLNVYIVVDAVDEILDTDGRDEACKLLEELSQSPKTHVLMTSRKEHDIMESMSECNRVIDVSIQNSEVDLDIQTYVREQLKQDKKLKKWSVLHPEIEDVLSRKTDGM
jgi:Cdc6-like AAA superfamily ATPase